MTKELEVNDNTAQDQERQPQQQSGGERNPQKLQGKALQVNENSVEDEVSARSPALLRRGSGGKRTRQKLQGKALRVNKISRLIKNQIIRRRPSRPMTDPGVNFQADLS